MRRFFILSSFSLTLFVGAALPAYAANLPLLDPHFSIVPSECTACPCDYGGVLQLIQNLINAGVAIGVLAFILLAVFAGATIMLNPTSPEKRTQARGMVINVIVGMIILLAAWLVVDFFMKALYAGDNKNPNGYGPWNSILAPGAANSWCITQKDTTAIPGLAGSLVTSLVGGTQTTGTVNYSGGTGVAGAQCSSSNTACSVSSLQAAGLSNGQAQAMSCIAVTESSGNPSQPPYNTVHPGSDSTACGTFQITKTTWNQTAKGACSNFSNCTNASCNEQVAATLVSNSGYSSWTCPGCNNKAQACVSKYGGG